MESEQGKNTGVTIAEGREQFQLAQALRFIAREAGETMELSSGELNRLFDACKVRSSDLVRERFLTHPEAVVTIRAREFKHITQPALLREKAHALGSVLEQVSNTNIRIIK